MKFLDLFSGVGGFRLGMTQAGHECVGHCEIDKFANASYEAIHEPKESEWFATDIRGVRANELPRADVWCFGFPCQDISIAGSQSGFTSGKRSSLFFTVTRLIRDTEEENRPTYLFIENVKNLLSINRGFDFAKLLIELDEIGYDAEWQVINSKNFGVPQNRERVFIIGHFRGRGTGEIFPIERENKGTLRQIVGGADAYRVYDSNGVARTLKAEAGGVGAKTGLYLINQQNGSIKFRNDFNCLDANYYKGLDCHQQRTGVLCINTKNADGKQPPQQDRIYFTDGVMTTISAELSGRFNILKPSSKPFISKTIRCGGRCSYHGSPYNWDTYKVNGRIRRLTPRECWRLQGFPDWAFDRAAKVNSDTQLYKQAGNSVTVPVI